MLLLVDTVLFNYLNIFSLLIILSLLNFNLNKLFYISIIDIIFNKIPYITLIVILIYYFNKILNKFLLNNKIGIFITILIDMISFIFLLCLLKNYNILYIIKTYYLSFIFNILIYILYILSK